MTSDAELDEVNALSTAETTAVPSTPTKRKRLAESDTGNKTNEPVVYPAYWDLLVQYIGDKSGLSSVNFGQSAHSESTKRKAEVDAEIERQREQRRKKEKVGIGQGLVLLGENLAKALVQRQAPQPVLAPTLLAECRTLPLPWVGSAGTVDEKERSEESRPKRRSSVE
ncbi:hypothetical protein PR003_g2283 [Phytophthora rubi]|uniref:Uncharacterized protein n=1 Tax=Phytophthora rubi TaxID=129364 RepID=A0A6A4FYN8_9STRA|nr:hypothetical protein PR001_g2178 [Phytophthora rubi]KAE9356469.1 hypothetical protein PR003_g2283 [Phytophthora rubi]